MIVVHVTYSTRIYNIFCSPDVYTLMASISSQRIQLSFAQVMRMINANLHLVLGFFEHLNIYEDMMMYTIFEFLITARIIVLF